MLSLFFSALLAATPGMPVELRAGEVEPDELVTPRVSGLAVPAQARAGIYLYGALSTSARPVRALLLHPLDRGAPTGERQRGALPGLHRL